MQTSNSWQCSFSDRYFERLLSEQAPPPPPLRHYQQSPAPSPPQHPSSAFSVYAPPSPPPPSPPSPPSRSPLRKRHQRPAHKQAELRRLFKIREGIQVLSGLCGIGEREARHLSEAATLRQCRDRMLEAEMALAAQNAEIDQLRRALATSALPSGQAIDYVQTRWLECPRFELFYKLAGKSLTEAFTSHLQAADGGRETFPDQWLARVRQEDLLRRSARHLGRVMKHC